MDYIRIPFGADTWKEYMKLALIPDFKQAWKFLSVLIATAAGTAMELYELVPQFKAYISDSVFHHLMVVLIVCIIAGRVIKQGAPNVPPQ
jgi:hypothetical protein